MTARMNAPGTPPPHRLPVLTEVVRLTDAVPMDDDIAVAVDLPVVVEAVPPARAAGLSADPAFAWAAPTVATEAPVVEAPHPPAALPVLTEQPAPPLQDGPAPPEWLKRRASAMQVHLPLPAMAPPSPLPPDFSGSWWSRDEGPAVVASPIPVPVPIPAPLHVPGPTEDVLVQRVLDGLGGQIDLMFDHRMREAVLPALARAADGLIEDLRTELTRTLNEMVSRAVAVELARERQRREDS